MYRRDPSIVHTGRWARPRILVTMSSEAADMGMSVQDGLWSPQVGDYARLRCNHTLAEVIDIVGQPDDRRYVLNILVPLVACPLIARLDDLESVWRTGDAPGRARSPRYDLPDPPEPTRIFTRRSLTGAAAS